MSSLHYNRGFSLAELSASLVIIAILLGSAISVSVSKTDSIKKKQTLAKMETIERSIASFAKLRGRIPCPGYSSLSHTNSNSGKEYCWGITAKDMSGSLPSGFSSTAANNWIITGTVPTKTLNLPDEFMLDGWGNRFTYVITTALGANHGAYDAPATTYSLRNTNKGIIIIQDANFTQITNEAAFAVISHGSNGYGAWNPSGSQNTAPTDAAEIKNYYPAGVYAGAMAFVAKEPVASSLIPYDDIVHYRTKDQLVQEAGALLSDTVCTTAETVLNTPDTQIDSLYYSTFCGVTPGNAHCKDYLTMLANQVNKWCL